MQLLKAIRIHNMKKLLMLMAVAAAISPQAQVLTTNWTGGFANGGVIPDNEPTGLVISEMLSGWSGSVSNMSVTLNLTGGWNGDIYAYLYHDGVMSVLLNRVGTPANSGLGYGDNGFNVTLTYDTAFSSIHNYQADAPTMIGGVLQGMWQPDGAGLGVFNGLDTSDTWSLFLADLNPGSVMTLNSWGLQAQVIPEPYTLALSAVGTLAGLLLFRRRK